MNILRKLLIFFLISLLTVVSACGKSSGEPNQDQVSDEKTTEEVNEQEDKSDDELHEDKEELIKEKDESNQVKNGAEDDKQGVQSDEDESKQVEKKSSSIEKNNKSKSTTTTKKSESKKSNKSSSTSKKKESKPKSNTNNQSNNNQSSSNKQPSKEEKVEQTVTVAVSIPSEVKKGSGLSPTTVTISDGDTVLDASLKTSIQINYSGSGGTAYIKGINGLNEFDEGPLSGWLVKVDGTMINRSAGSFEVKANQKIEWIYTTDYTN